MIPDDATDSAKVWTEHGISKAVKLLLEESNTLFDDMVKHLMEYPELNVMIQNILFQGTKYPYFQYNLPVSIGYMFGFLKEQDGLVSISNRIFETSLYNFYISEEITKNTQLRGILKDKNQFIKDGYLDDYGLDKGYLLSFNFNKIKRQGRKR